MPPVALTATAKQDIFELHLHIETHDSVERADEVLDGLRKAIESLADLPERGHFPPELDRIGLREYREIHHKPWRIVYAVISGAVVFHGILDGRRDLQTLLQQRLLR